MIAPSEKRPALLLVDDDAFALNVMSGLLESSYELTVAHSGAQAMEVLGKGFQPDLILLDVIMPEMDGFEVIRQIKAIPAVAGVPVIFLTGRSSKEDEITGLELGAVDFIAKPINPPVLLRRIRTHLALKQAMDAVQQRNTVLEDNLRAAGKIQEKLLPPKGLSAGPLTFEWRFRPCEAVGGDLLNFFPLDHDHFGVFVLDVEGHGLRAAMISSFIAQVMQPYSEVLVKPGPSGATIVRPGKVFERLAEMFTYDRFLSYFTIAYLIIEVSTGKVICSTAGHPNPLILRRDGTLVPLAAGGHMIGFFEGEYEEAEERLFPGDKLFLISDGVTDVRNPNQEPFGMERFRNVLTANFQHPVRIINEKIETALRDFSGPQKPFDDIALLGLQFG